MWFPRGQGVPAPTRVELTAPQRQAVGRGVLPGKPAHLQRMRYSAQLSLLPQEGLPVATGDSPAQVQAARGQGVTQAPPSPVIVPASFSRLPSVRVWPGQAFSPERCSQSDYKCYFYELRLPGPNASSSMHAR